LANFGTGDTVYTDSGGNSTLSAGDYFVIAASGGINFRSFFGCSDQDCPSFTVNSSGVITSTACGCP
jgi:hypothetical protein